jgi:hypothetical protein
MVGPGRKTWKYPSPAAFGSWVGFIVFLLALFIPAVYVAIHRRDVLPLSPEEERFLSYVRRNWTEEAGLLKALGIGSASGIAAVGSSLAARAIRRRESRRRA